MESAEIKLDLFRKLDQLDSEKLNEAYTLFIDYLNSLQSKDEWQSLSNEQKEKIEIALKETEQGEASVLAGFTNSLRKKYKLK